MGGIGQKGLIAAWGWAERESVGKQQFYSASLAFLGFYSSLFLLLFTITNIIIIIIIIFIIIVTDNFIPVIKLFSS